MFEKFLVSDWIQFAGVLVSMIIGVASIIIAIVTLRQNSKMIAESTRPYVVISFERTYTSTQRCYFVVRNYGQTGAYLTKLECLTPDLLENLKQDNLERQIQSIQNVFLAPGQKICLVISSPITLEDVSFLVEYSAFRKKYKEVFAIHIPLKSVIVRGHSTKGGEPNYLRDISYAMQEIVERNF